MVDMSDHQDHSKYNGHRLRSPFSDVLTVLQDMVKQFEPNEFKTACQQLAIDRAKQVLTDEEMPC
jgi:hypothetical protein